mmetsp:Transcript_21633/g.55687  ORF Transcript_21633/g.55687 Transcript_21633/m.55687 type:complete len:427 (+) Transcript_21633:277-1557(+)
MRIVPLVYALSIVPLRPGVRAVAIPWCGHWADAVHIIVVAELVELVSRARDFGAPRRGEGEPAAMVVVEVEVEFTRVEPLRPLEERIDIVVAFPPGCAAAAAVPAVGRLLALCAVHFLQPRNLLLAPLLRDLLAALHARGREGNGLGRGGLSDLVELAQQRRLHGPPAVILDAAVPAFSRLRLGAPPVKHRVATSRAVVQHARLELLAPRVVARRERADVRHGSVRVDLVVDLWRPLETAEPKAHVRLRCRVHQPRLARVDAAEELARVALLAKADEIHVVAHHAHACERTPASLDPNRREVCRVVVELVEPQDEHVLPPALEAARGDVEDAPASSEPRTTPRGHAPPRLYARRTPVPVCQTLAPRRIHDRHLRVEELCDEVNLDRIGSRRGAGRRGTRRTAGGRSAFGSRNAHSEAAPEPLDLDR